MTDMAALRAHHRGGPEVLTFERAPVPVPADGEVLIAVHAAAITFDELTWEETWLRDGATGRPCRSRNRRAPMIWQRLGPVYDVVIDTVGGKAETSGMAGRRSRAAAARTAAPARRYSSSATSKGRQRCTTSTRRSSPAGRLFLRDKPVPKDLVIEALELAVRAPSNSNIQPWHWCSTPALPATASSRHCSKRQRSASRKSRYFPTNSRHSERPRRPGLRDDGGAAARLRRPEGLQC